MSAQKSVINTVIFRKRSARISESIGTEWNGMKSKENNIAADEGKARTADDIGVNSEICLMNTHITITSGIIAKILAAASGYRLVDNTGLASHGGFKDWFIEYFNKPAYTIEIGKGKNPLPISDFDGIFEKTLPMFAVSTVI